MSEESTTRARVVLIATTDDGDDVFFDARTRSTAESPSNPPPGRDVIKDPKAFARALKRICNTMDTLTFRTEGGLRMMIRHSVDLDDDDDPPKALAFDVSFVVDSDDTATARCLKNEVDLETDDAGEVYVVDDFVLDETDEVDLREAVEAINELNSWTPCPCGDYLIKDGYKNPEAKMCYFCEMTSTDVPEDDDDHMCPICHEHGLDRWMVATTCCNQRMHKRCKAKCVDAARGRPTCPMCRAAW